MLPGAVGVNRQVKSARAEAALPQFDLGQKVGRKIGLQRNRRAVVLCVVDAADFDGSLPRTALQALFSNIEGYQVGLSRVVSQHGITHEADFVVVSRSTAYLDNEKDKGLLGVQVREEVPGRRGDNRDVRFVLAVNKADLLPAQATVERLEVRHPIFLIPFFLHASYPDTWCRTWSGLEMNQSGHKLLMLSETL